jgi:hypothetical protein
MDRVLTFLKCAHDDRGLLLKALNDKSVAICTLLGVDYVYEFRLIQIKPELDILKLEFEIKDCEGE